MQHPSTNAHRTHHPSRQPHARHRSASDPFLDPIYPAPYLPYRDDDHPRSAPVPPPKQLVKKPRQYNDARDPRMLEAAVRDAVTVRAVEQSPRAKIGRSQTGGVQTAASSSKPSPVASRRSYSQDSVTQTATAVEKARRAGKPKKGSTHADVIDRLDFTGVGPMFHHDGPFDACAPSRNRHKTKAPMLAWTSPPEDEAPASAAQLRADRRQNANRNVMSGNSDSPYPTVAYPSADQYAVPKNPKQVDRIAEAWGMHEPEPYEEFFGAGGARVNGDTASAASSIRAGMESHGQTQNGRVRTRDGRELREQFNQYLDEGRPQPTRKHAARNMPPPKPIDLPGATARPQTADAMSYSLPSPGIASPGAPKRTKSLMQKFRRMRDAPNIPVGDAAEEEDGSPPSSIENYTNGTHGTGASAGGADGGRMGRPSHRHQNSFFGRFGRNASAHAGQISPTAESSEQYVYVQAGKALPPRPQESPASPGNEKDGYFDAPTSPGGTATTPGGGLGRKTSLMKKVKGVVRGAGNK